MSKTHNVSIDTGTGGTNAVKETSRGKNKTVYFPSVRAVATGDTLGLGDMELDYTYYDWNSYRYVIGDDVLRVTRRAVERHHSKSRYGGEFQHFQVAAAIANLGIKDGTVDLTLFCPPGMFNASKPLMEKTYVGNASITVKGDSKPRQWTYGTVHVLPEGVGAALCFALDDNGDIVNHDVLNGSVLILDLGMYTGDALLLKDGELNPEDLQHATWDNAGLAAHIHNPILAQLKKMSDDFSVCTIDDIDLAMRGDYIVRSGAAAVDIEPMVKRLGERYASWLMNNIINGVFNNLNGIKSLVIVGGGALLVMDHFRNEYNTKNQNKILDPREHPLTMDIHPVYMNAVGGLRFANMKQKA